MQLLLDHICILLIFLHSATTQCANELNGQRTLAPETVQEIFLNNNEDHIWTSLYYPNSYPYLTRTLIIKANLGYSISVTVEELDLNGECGDFLVIKSGNKLQDDQPGKIFTYKLKSERIFLIHSNYAYFSFQVFGKNVAEKAGFRLKYRRVGTEAETTTENPTTEISWPTPSGSDSVYYTGYIAGKNQNDFKNSQTLDNLKEVMVEMATEHCQSNNIALAEPITISNIHIYYIIECPYTWPDSETCVKMRFAIPVFLNENSLMNNTYQLVTEELDKMWTKLADKYLQKLSMTVYSEPDNTSSLRTWMIISGITLGLFVLLLYGARIIGVSFSPSNIKSKMMGGDDTVYDKYRTSDLSIPPLFDTDNHFYPEFVPDVDSQKQTYTTRNDFTDSESEEEIIYTNFSDSRNNTVQRNNRESQS